MCVRVVRVASSICRPGTGRRAQARSLLVFDVITAEPSTGQSHLYAPLFNKAVFCIRLIASDIQCSVQEIR